MNMDADQIHQVVMNLLLPALVVFAVGVGYVFFIRPELRKNPAFTHLYDQEDSFFLAMGKKFSGLKQKLTFVGLGIAGFVVEAHDTLAPLIAQAGVDPTLILPKVPSYVWPIAAMAILWLVQRFRDQADRAARANAEALLNAGHSLAAPAPGLPVNTLPSPNPLANLPDKPGA